MEINRSFNHRTFGAVGSVVLSVPNGKWTLDGHELPAESVGHLARFALQTLQDAYAGAKSTDEATGAFNKKYDALLNGTIGQRGESDGASEFTRVARSVVRSLMKARFGAKSTEWAAFGALSDDEQNAKLDANYEKFADKLRPAVEEEMERRAAKRATKADISVDFTL